MTYNNREVQPELFGKVNKKQKQNLLGKNIFCSHYKSEFSVSLDTLIVVIIGVLMVNLASFVMGIEKGKTIAKNDLKTDVCVQPTDSAAVATIKPQKTLDVSVPADEKVLEKPAEISNSVQEPVVASTEKSATGYIIQLATYKNDSSANQEVSRLGTLGLECHVLKSGEYFIVYAGTYNSKINAKEKLGSFKGRFKDCYVRSLNKS